MLKNAPLKEDANLSMPASATHAHALEHVQQRVDRPLARDDARAHVGEDDPLPPRVGRLRRELVEERGARPGGHLCEVPRPARDLDRAGKFGVGAVRRRRGRGGAALPRRDDSGGRGRRGRVRRGEVRSAHEEDVEVGREVVGREEESPSRVLRVHDGVERDLLPLPLPLSLSLRLSLAMVRLRRGRGPHVRELKRGRRPARTVVVAPALVREVEAHARTRHGDERNLARRAAFADADDLEGDEAEG